MRGHPGGTTPTHAIYATLAHLHTIPAHSTHHCSLSPLSLAPLTPPAFTPRFHLVVAMLGVAVLQMSLEHRRERLVRAVPHGHTRCDAEAASTASVARAARAAVRGECTADNSRGRGQHETGVIGEDSTDLTRDDGRGPPHCSTAGQPRRAPHLVSIEQVQ